MNQLKNKQKKGSKKTTKHTIKQVLNARSCVPHHVIERQNDKFPSEMSVTLERLKQERQREAMENARGGGSRESIEW